MDTTSAKEKIRKLLNLANNDGAFEGEIDNALRFARRLMLQHNLTEKDVAQDPHEQAAEVEYNDAETVSSGQKWTTWESWIAHAVCDLIGTVSHYRSAVVEKRHPVTGTLIFDGSGGVAKGVRAVFYGPAEDARDAAEMFAEWSHVIAAMSRMKYGGCFRGAGKSYADGFGLGIHQKVEKIRREERAQLAAPEPRAVEWTGDLFAPAPEPTTGGALVLRSSLALMAAKKDAGKAWLEKEKGVKLRNSGARRFSISNAGAFAAGKVDGGNANFSRARALKIGR